MIWLEEYISSIYDAGMDTIKRPDRLTESLLLRLQPAEKIAFQDAAELAGIPLSAWIRERLRRAAITDLESIGQMPEFLKNA